MDEGHMLELEMLTAVVMDGSATPDQESRFEDLMQATFTGGTPEQIAQLMSNLPTGFQWRIMRGRADDEVELEWRCPDLEELDDRYTMRRAYQAEEVVLQCSAPLYPLQEWMDANPGFSGCYVLYVRHEGQNYAWDGRHYMQSGAAVVDSRSPSCRIVLAQITQHAPLSLSTVEPPDRMRGYVEFRALAHAAAGDLVTFNWGQQLQFLRRPILFDAGARVATLNGRYCELAVWQARNFLCGLDATGIIGMFPCRATNGYIYVVDVRQLENHLPTGLALSSTSLQGNCTLRSCSADIGDVCLFARTEIWMGEELTINWRLVWEETL